MQLNVEPIEQIGCHNLKHETYFYGAFRVLFHTLPAFGHMNQLNQWLCKVILTCFLTRWSKLETQLKHA